MKDRKKSIVLALVLLLSCVPASAQGARYDFSGCERYVADDCSFAVLRPKGWQVGGQLCGTGAMISIFDPRSPSAVKMTQLSLQGAATDAVGCAAANLRTGKGFYPDLALEWARATDDRSKSVVEYRYTSPGKVPMRSRAYFIVKGPLLTVFEYEADAREFSRLAPTLLTILTNITILDPAAYRRQQASAPAPAFQPVSLPLASRVVKDRSCGMLVPEGWGCEGGKGTMMAVSPDGAAGFVFSSVDFYGRSNIPYFDSASIPGGLHYNYMAPMDAMVILLQAYGSRDVRVLERAPNPAKAREIAEGLRRGADAEVAQLSYTTAKGARVKGWFDVVSLRPLNSGQWGILFNGVWAPEAEFDRYLPMLVQMAESFRIDLQWAQRYIEAGLANLRRLMKETAAKAARAAEDIRNSSNAAYEERQRSQAYIDYRRTGYIRGEQEWISGAEGGSMIKTDAWGMSTGGEYVTTSPAYNYYNFEGRNHGYTPVDASREVYESVYGTR